MIAINLEISLETIVTRDGVVARRHNYAIIFLRCDMTI